MSRRPYALGFCAGEYVTTRFLLSLAMVIDADRPELLAKVGGPTLHLWRNALAADFLRTGIDDLLMVDTDMVFTTRDVDALMADPDPLVAGVTVDASGKRIDRGCAFVKINRQVFEDIGERPFNPITTKDGDVSSEDVAFWARARKAGFETKVLEEVSVGHVKPVTLWLDREINAEITSWAR